VNANGASATVRFELTTTPGDYNNAQILEASPAVASGIMPVAVGANLNGLAPRTTYYYRVIANTASGEIVGAELELTTLAVTYIPLTRR
jgi:phosphodiesterase/alkaline phosphatase D-like protein